MKSLGPPQVLRAFAFAFAFWQVHDQNRARLRSGSARICGTKNGLLLHEVGRC